MGRERVVEVLGGRPLGDCLFLSHLLAAQHDVVVEVVIDLDPSHAPIIFIFSKLFFICGSRLACQPWHDRSQLGVKKTCRIL